METNENKQLPLEQQVKVPIELIINFDNIDGQNLDQIEDEFNDLGKNIPRDKTCRVESITELVKKFNDYDYSGSSIGKCVGVVCVSATCGCYLTTRRHTVPAGHFGHFISSGIHMLTLPGIHMIISTTDKWKGIITIDDELRLVRQYGSRTILLVPQNHIAGGFKIGKTDENTDGEFVIFTTGRHILYESIYRGICSAKLEGDIVNL